MNDSAAIVTAAHEQPKGTAARAGSLTRRMIGIAALVFVALLVVVFVSIAFGGSTDG